MPVINTNVKSLISQAALQRNSRDLASAMQQLSTGKRINSAADDAAGLAITNKMTAQVRGLDQAARNAMDGISMLQTIEGATIEVTNMLQRMRELTVQAANGTNSPNNTDSLQEEFLQLQQEVKRIVGATEWNGMALMDTASGVKTLQIGANASQVLNVTFDELLDSTPLTTATDEYDPSTTHGLHVTDTGALAIMDEAVAYIDGRRAYMGATINRLQHTIDNLTNVSINTSESRSRILDADYAKASSELARTQIIQQAATSVLAQANVDQQSVLKLLQGG